MGLSRIDGNVLFNGCRESNTHGNFNSWDRTPMLHNTSDSYGAPSWSPGVSTVARNLLVNSYGAGHGIDHDDGSMVWQDVHNVIAYSHACKGNFGSNRNCSYNMVIAPELKDAYSTDPASSSAPCAEQANNGKGSTFANKYFENNTCVFLADKTAEAYSFKSCHAPKAGTSSDAELGGTVWGTANNRFLVLDGVDVAVPCDDKKPGVPLKTWQGQYKQERGGSVGPMPSVAALRAMAEGVLAGGAAGRRGLERAAT